MKYIKRFESEALYELFKLSEDYITPNVSWCENEYSTKYNPYIPPHDYSNDYLTIISTSDNNTIGWKASNSLLTKTISVSTDNGQTWTDVTSNTSGITIAILNTGDKLLIKGSNNVYGANIDYYNYFTSTGQFNVEGNIMSMIYGDNFIGQTTLSSSIQMYLMLVILYYQLLQYRIIVMQVCSKTVLVSPRHLLFLLLRWQIIVINICSMVVSH